MLFAVSNREAVTVQVWPLPYQISLGLYAVILWVLLIGFLVGLIVAWIMGGLMLYANPALLSEHWMHAKLTLVVLMSAVHGILARNVRKFAKDENQKNSKYFRILNEIPTVLMVAIIILAVVEPF